MIITEIRLSRKGNTIVLIISVTVHRAGKDR